MKNEIIYRICRIILVIVFVVFFSMVRNTVKASYDEASTIIDSMPGFTVEELNNRVDKRYGLKEEHSVQIKNITHKKQDISFVLNNTNEEYPYNYMNYTILKNNTIVKQGIVKEEGVLYKTSITSNEDSVYKIVFNISQEDINALGGISTYAEFTFI